jgi:hypothetical protein
MSLSLACRCGQPMVLDDDALIKVPALHQVVDDDHVRCLLWDPASIQIGTCPPNDTTT